MLHFGKIPKKMVKFGENSAKFGKIWAKSRRAAAGRAQLLAKSAHAGHLRLPAEPLEVAEKFGKLPRRRISEFKKNAAFWKNPEKIWSNLAKIQQNSGKICDCLGKNSKKFSNF